MSAYQSLAISYDRLTRDVPYGEIFSFIQAILAERGIAPRSAVDLACGTGSLSVLLAKAGYRVTGVDMSEQMLTMASEKAWALPGNRPFFVRQRMQRLALPEPVELVVSCLDSINYLTRPADCQETFRRVYQALAPGGAFIFDVNTPETLQAMDGQIFLDEDDDVYCVWRGEFDPASRLCRYGMDLFQRQGRLWHRSWEEHMEYAYPLDDLERYLTQAGFQGVRRLGDRRLAPPEPGEQRVYFYAEKEK